MIKATGTRSYTGKVGSDDVDDVDKAYRLVADHIRALSIAIADGSFPGSDGCEYVLRRILSRAVRVGTKFLKADKGFFSRLVKVVVEVMGDVFPELKQYEEHIVETIASEEISFGRTFLKDMAKESDLEVDIDGFNKAMNEARERSRKAQNKKVTSLNGLVESAPITVSKKTDMKAKVSKQQNQVIKAKKKTAEENIKKAIKTVSKQAETVCSKGKLFCTAHASVGSDNAAIREAVVRVMKQKENGIMVFSTDERKTLVRAGVPEKYVKQLNVLEWLKIALKPLNGKGGGGKGGLAQGQGSVISNLEDAMRGAEIYGDQNLKEH